MTLKTCSKCGKQKSIDDFFRSADNKKDGHDPRCKACKQAVTMAWREKNKDKYNEYMRARNKHHYPEYRLRRYDLTSADHARMMLEQGGVCALCEKPQKGKRPLVVDHDHNTGEVRGLLCYGCNRLIVPLDNHPLYLKALRYLKKSA